jgi:prolyl-tRNA editing enzyme YbaK/EbsC (Cys-tRNA(Pro) deacylase)
MVSQLSPAAQRVQDALEALGLSNVVIEHEQTTRSAREAAQAIGCDVAQIVKSLIFRTKESHKPVLVLASGPNRVNELHLGEQVGEAIERANPDFVQAVTGFVIGGVPPLAHPSRIMAFIDEDLMTHNEIWAAGGSPNAVFKLTPAEMVTITQGQVISII